uniref:Uncharacterized protein n=1 Tax=Coccidioides posadasii RMSCC 3488 TaxID=454284 RepID=A0A0J6FCS5_COCPO|nr:hypothetical protein CPAG_04420 [Coccidioides posadasii RMSCC 3488]
MAAWWMVTAAWWTAARRATRAALGRRRGVPIQTSRAPTVAVPRASLHARRRSQKPNTCKTRSRRLTVDVDAHHRTRRGCNLAMLPTQKQRQSSSSTNAPARDPITIPAIAPPLSPPLPWVIPPINVLPSVLMAGIKPTVVVGAFVAVTVASLVGLVGGLAEGNGELPPSTQTPFALHVSAAVQQVSPHGVSPREILHCVSPGEVGEAARLPVEVTTTRSVRVYIVVKYSHSPLEADLHAAWPSEFV